MENNPLVSIIVNCQNGEKYLNDSLQSILSQTYKNWEIIFWDNNSTDFSAKIYKSYKDSRFKYFFAEKKVPLYNSRNFAIEKSKGDFISFLDTDDIWDKNKLELQMPYFENPEIGMVYSNYWLMKKNKKKKKLFSKKKLPSGNIHSNLIKNYSIGILTAIIRKEFYLKLEKKFDNRYSIIGDFDFFLRLSKKCIFHCVQKPLAYYRLHGGNISTKDKNKEISEFEIWLNENKFNLSEFDFNNLRRKVDYRKFVNYKMDGDYKKCMYFLLNNKINLFSFKSLFIFFAPIFLLKKLLWYHQD